MENVKEKDRGSNENTTAFEKMKKEIENIKYGSVTAVIQEGKIVQLDTTAKIRLF